MAPSDSTAQKAAVPPRSGASAAAGGRPIEGGARLLPLHAGFYAFSLLSPARGGGPSTPSSGATAVEICAAPGSAALQIANLSGGDDPWLTTAQHLFVAVPPGGGRVLLTGYPARTAQVEPIEIEIRRLDRNRAGDAPTTPFDCEALVLGLGSGGMAEAAGRSPLAATAVHRGAGEVRFLDAEWIGRLGRGLWIESFSLNPRGQLSATPIEYKALTADGEETAWIGSAAACGTGRGTTPLIGFSVRQVPGSGPPVFDCEYSGYFQSGTISGPTRNGAPCLSPVPNDPLEGLQLRMVPRQPRTGA
jgi:hypothetical protein